MKIRWATDEVMSQVISLYLPNSRLGWIYYKCIWSGQFSSRLVSFHLEDTAPSKVDWLFFIFLLTAHSVVTYGEKRGLAIKFKAVYIKMVQLVTK